MGEENRKIVEMSLEKVVVENLFLQIRFSNQIKRVNFDLINIIENIRKDRDGGYENCLKKQGKMNKEEEEEVSMFGLVWLS